MYEIVTKQELAPNIYLIELAAADIAKKSNPGQFVIIRLDDKGERVPLTIAGVDIEKGTVSTAFHVVGRTTKKLAKLKVIRHRPCWNKFNTGFHITGHRQ